MVSAVYNSMSMLSRNGLPAERVILNGTHSTLQVLSTTPKNFLRESKLPEYLKQKLPEVHSQEKTAFTLREILDSLKKIIDAERQYDESNPSIILCNEELEAALNVRALHVTEVRDFVLKQFAPGLASTSPSSHGVVPPFRPGLLGGQQQKTTFSPLAASQGAATLPRAATLPSPSAPTTTLQRTTTTLTTSSNTFDTNGFFTLDPDFLDVLQRVPDVGKDKTVFTYDEVTKYLSRYILDNRVHLFDERNIKVAICEKDPLGKAFKVRAFHRTQVPSFLRKLLYPYKPQKKFEVEKGSMETQFHISFGASRKRTVSSDSDDQGFSEVKRRRKVSVSVVSVGADYESSSDETIYSAQGYETVPICDVDPDAQSEEEEVEEDHTAAVVYSVEYELDSTDDDEDDPKDGSNSGSDLDDSADDEPRRLMTVVVIQSDSENWADSESDFELANYDEELPRGAENWKCVTCGQPNEPFIRYCHRCWQERKGWVPDRPKPRKRSKESRLSKDKRTAGQIVKGSSFKRPFLERSLSEPAKDKGDEGTSTETSHLFEKAVGPGSSVDSGLGSSQELLTSAESSGMKASASSTEDSDDTVTTKESDDVKMEPEFKLKKFSTVATSDPDQYCPYCVLRPKNASIIHGKIAHTSCCYQCAKRLWKKNKSCPICRRKIEKICKNIVV